MAEIKRDVVKRSFGSHASQYDALARVQKSVTARLIEQLETGGPPPAALLDIGAGTGRLLEQLGRIFPQSTLVGVDLAFQMAQVAENRLAQSNRGAMICSDAESLPFKEGSFDLVVSTSTYQWIAPLSGAFAEACRVLRPGCRFRFALFGEKTLFELKESYKKALIETGGTLADRTHRFAGADEVLAALSSAGFRGCRVHAEMETEMHSDVTALLRSLKGIGAGSAARSSESGLSGRSTMLRMMEIYRKNYGTERGVRATYEVLYGFGEKP